MSDVITRLTTALDSRYRIDRQVGIGGMATVYLAHDIRHDRDVAIKVLHPDLAAALGAERFLAEIKTTAKLQHPHILPLLDSGEADGLLYYVMPYVAGESLRARLDRETQLAVDDAVRVAREVASALDYAHRNGVVHRDIKPENILIHEDQALVADFGISLAVSAAGGARMTQTGLSLGTPQYMSPEQAMGERAIDGRADIYALGAVTYEMLVGEPPFTGPTVQAIVARVMTESPRPVTGQRRSVPANVNAAVLRALEKLPADRFHSPAEFSAALVSTTYESAGTGQLTSAPNNSKTLTAVLPWGIAAIAVVAAIVFALRGQRNTGNETPMHLSLDLPTGASIPAGTIESIGISNDGSYVAVGVVVGGRSYILQRKLNEDEFHIVTGSAGAAASAVFSRDGKWLAFNAPPSIYRVPVSGGPATKIADSRWAHIAWAADNSIIYTKDYNTGLYRTSLDGRETSTLTVPDVKKSELGQWWPQLLPDGDHVLFTNYTTPADRSRIEVLSLKSKERKVVLEGGYYGRYVGGKLLFVRGESVLSVPFDASSLKVTGTETAVPLEIDIDPPNGWAGFDVAQNGTLVYLTDAAKGVQLTWSNANGDEESAVDSVGRYAFAVPSPDGKKIAVVKDGDLWIMDRARKLGLRLTRTEQREIAPVWTPDSRTILYSRDVPQYEIFENAIDGSGQERLLVSSPNDKHPRAVTPDGKTLIYQESSMQGNDVLETSMANPNAGRHVLLGGFGNQEQPSLSPDAQWLTYTSNETGRDEIYISPYPVNRGPARQQVSDNGGDDPAWAPDGKSIYYLLAGQMRRVGFNPASGDLGAQETLKRVPPVTDWRMGPDGRFLVMRESEGAKRHSVKILFNWIKTLDARN
jgi:serine/threonine protein kinase